MYKGRSQCCHCCSYRYIHVLYMYMYMCIHTYTGFSGVSYPHTCSFLVGAKFILSYVQSLEAWLCNSKSLLARDLWSKNHSLSLSYRPWTQMVLDHKSMATGLLLLYIPPDWSLQHTWSVHSIHENIHDVHKNYILYMMYIITS